VPHALPFLPFLLSVQLKRQGRDGANDFQSIGTTRTRSFCPGAWGHLLSLSGSGALNSAELEHIIERALIQIDGRIALDDLRSLLEGAGFIESGDGDQHQTVH